MKKNHSDDVACCVCYRLLSEKVWKYNQTKGWGAYCYEHQPKRKEVEYGQGYMSPMRQVPQNQE